MQSNVQYFIREKGSSDWIDIESTFHVRYVKCEGLEDMGSAKNIYTEKYADSPYDRCYVPQIVHRESTTIKFTFAFFGNNKQTYYDSFVNYLSGKVLEYYDTKRYRKAEMILSEGISPTQDNYIGKPFMVCPISFKNLKGFCEYVPPTPI